MIFQNVIFDMDGTLFASEQYWRRAQIEAIADFYGVVIPKEEWEPLLDLWYSELNDLVLERFGVKVDHPALRPTMRAKMQKYYDSADIPRIPYSLEFIKTVRAHGAHIAIATTTPAFMCEGFLERMDIAPYIDGLFTVDMVTRGKADAPDIYDLALERIGGNKENTVVFEDTFAPVRTLHAASYRVIGVRNAQQKRYFSEMEPLCEMFISSYKEVLDKYELQCAQ